MNINIRTQQVGIDRSIRLKWLNYTAQLVLAGNNDQAIKTDLEKYLSKYFSTSVAVRGSLSKTITILIKTWVRVPSSLESFRNDGLELLKKGGDNVIMPVNWGMISATYPFWGSVAYQTGRLLRLQNEVVASQVQRRIREQYGERETVSRRVRYVLRAFIDWGALIETGTTGTYSPTPPLKSDDTKLVSWLIESILHSRINGSTSMRDLLESPSLFPFRLRSITADHLHSVAPRLECVRHGLDEDLVMLKK